MSPDNTSDRKSFEKCSRLCITLAGNTTTFTIQNGGSATLIAGQRIDMLPGTTIHPGGYLHGYIAPSGPWCNSGSVLPMVTENPKRIKTHETIVKDNLGSSEKLFSLYPNPTTGTFTLELFETDIEKPVLVEIFGIRGERELSTTLSGSRKYEISLENKPVGLYFIRVVSGDRAETGKIVKL